MSNPTLKILLKEYEQNRLQKQLDLEDKLNKFYLKNPDVANINDKINRISIEISKTILLNKNSDKLENFNIQLDNLKKKKQELLNKLNIKCGCIINISSIWGITGASCEVHYSVAKAGIDGMTKSLAKELAPSNIRVNSIAPGAIMTDMCADYTEEEIKDINKQIPLGKFGEGIDIAKCVKWLIEDNYTTGQVISPNGGWVI